MDHRIGHLSHNDDSDSWEFDTGLCTSVNYDVYGRSYRQCRRFTIPEQNYDFLSVSFLLSWRGGAADAP